VANPNGDETTSRRILALAAGVLAGLAAIELLRRRRAARGSAPGADPDPRTEELRRKLAVTAEPAEPPPEPQPDVDAARRLVHEEGRAAIEEMERTGEP
jgi:hypothetical protein